MDKFLNNLMSNRWWWNSHQNENLDEVNFLWTPWILDSEVQKLPSNTKTPRITSRIKENKEEIDNCVYINLDPFQSNTVRNKLRVSSSMSSLPQNENKRINVQDNSLVSNLKHENMVITSGFIQDNSGKKLYNKLEANFNLSSKKWLFLNMKNYYSSLDQDVFDVIPLTFHIKNGENDPEYLNFKSYFEQEQLKCHELINSKNAWIVKPGEDTNRGQGIRVTDKIETITKFLNEHAENSKHTCIVQKYICNPLLIKRRKFDIRMFAMITCYNKGYIKGYFYNEGYLRTSSKEFSLNDLENLMVHLTNDAVQVNDEDYGKFEMANKLSFSDFQKFLDTYHDEKSIDFKRDLLPQIRSIIADTMKAVSGKIDPNMRSNTFEIFGYDFMIDEDFKIYLIEVNTNPCLDQCCPLLSRVIRSMLENSLLICLDPMFSPPDGFLSKKSINHDFCKTNRFELIFMLDP